MVGLLFYGAKDVAMILRFISKINGLLRDHLNQLATQAEAMGQPESSAWLINAASRDR